jgi:predicted nucleic acid-binding protein
MAWVVDTCILIDVAIDDPAFGTASAGCLQSRLRQGLLICPVTHVEIGPVFEGDLARQEQFLDDAGIDWREPWTLADTERAYKWWTRHILEKRQRKTGRRPVADVLIGAFASRFNGLITRNLADFEHLCPGLRIVEPR